MPVGGLGIHVVHVKAGEFIVAGDVAIWTFAPSVTYTLLRGHTAPITSVAFSPDGTRLATASRDGTVRIWAIRGQHPAITLRGHPGAANHVAFSPNGQLLASLDNDGSIRIWKISAANEPTLMPPFGPAYRTVTFHPDGRQLITTHDDGSVRAWPCHTCQPINEVLTLAHQRITRTPLPGGPGHPR